MNEKPSYEELRQKVKELEKIESAYKQSELKLQKSEKRSRAWLENSPVCTKMLDLDFNLQYMSSAGIKSLQIDDVTTLYGNPYPFHFYPESFRSRMVQNLEKAVATKEIVTQEASVVDVEGNELWFHSTIVPVEDAEGRIEYIIVVSIDTTDRKLVELELAKHGEQLESLVEQRTAELRQSQKMEALGTLAGGIAHDFNNILAAILGQAELYMDKLPADSEGWHYVESISKSGNRAADLVRQIMTFSRMDTTSFKPLNLSLVVHEALKMVTATSPANIEIRQNLPEDCLAISADETQIHQIVHNLCSNAIHSMGESGGVLEITLEEDRDCHFSMGGGDGRCLKLTVKDSGQGIKPEDQELIFDPFFTTKDVGKGTGLGLSVVHGIMKSHQAKITVESEIEKGTSFSLFFPTIDEEIQETNFHNSALRKGKGHVLIVEDEPLLADIYREFLEGLGYVVTVSGNGFDALTKLKESPSQFDLVITDHSMPNMTGKQLTPKLLDIRADIPIILITGYSALMSEEEAQALGIRKYLLKPLKLALLKETIDECLRAP